MLIGKATNLLIYYKIYTPRMVTNLLILQDLLRIPDCYGDESKYDWARLPLYAPQVKQVEAR